MTQQGPLNLLNHGTAVTSITATSPLAANGVSGVPETGDVTISIAGSGFVNSITGTANQVLANGTSGSPQTGGITLTLPQSIGTGNSPTFTGLTLSGLTPSEAVVTNGSDVLASLAYSSTGGTSNLVSRDANGNTHSNNFESATTGNAAAGTITLTAASTRIQVFSSGSGSATVVLPDATTLLNGHVFELNNNASGTISVQLNGGGALFSMVPGSYAEVILLSNTFPAGQWDYHWLMPSNASYGTAGLNVTGKIVATSSIAAPAFAVTGSSSGIISILPQAAAGTYNFNLPTTAGTSGYFLTSDGGGSGGGMTWTSPSSSLVTSISGTTNQITASASTGSVTLSLPNGISLGSYQSTSPPTGGLIMPGALGVNSSSIQANTIMTVVGGAYFTCTDDTAWVFDASASGRLGVVKKSGLDPQFVVAEGVPMIFSEANNTNLITTAVTGYVLTQRMIIDSTGKVAVGPSSPDSTSIFSLFSTTLGFLPPSMTTTQKNAISGPTAGLTVYDNVLNDLQFYNGASWVSSSGVTSITGTAHQIAASASTGAVTLSLTNGISLGSYQSTGPPAGGILASGAVSIGTTNASYMLEVAGDANVSYVNCAIGLYNTAASGGTTRIYAIGPRTDGTLAFADDTAMAIRMTINTSGYVGIGTTSPSGFLNVAGSITGSGIYGALFQTNLTQNGSASGTCGVYIGGTHTVNGSGSNTVSYVQLAPTVVATSAISNAYGMQIYGGSASGSGGITHAYGLNVTTPGFGTSSCAIYSDNIAVGYSGVSPPSSGLIVSGQTGLGVTTANINAYCQVDIQGNSYPYALRIDGTQTTNDSGSSSGSIYSFVCQPTIAPSLGGGTCAGIISLPEWAVPSGKTITTAAAITTLHGWSSNVGTVTTAIGLYVKNSSGAGTITTGYAIYADTPTYASTNHVAYLGGFQLEASGVVSAGTWEGTVVGPTYGGTGVNNGSKTITLGSFTSGYVLTSDSSGNATWAAAPVTSVTGTTNQVIAFPTTGGVELSTPQNIDTAASVTFGELDLKNQGEAMAFLSESGSAGQTYISFYSYAGDTLTRVGYIGTINQTSTGGVVLNADTGGGVVIQAGTGPIMINTDATQRMEMPNGGTVIFYTTPIPSSNKGVDMGTTLLRWGTVYNGTNTTGTSRLASAQCSCSVCSQPMMRGTGTLIILGETADYIPCWCTNASCSNIGIIKMDVIQHLPSTQLAQILPPSQIKFLGFKVSQNSGNSRSIQVCFDYGNGKLNSTYLTDVEYTQYLALSADSDKINFIQNLGLIEWNALEITRLLQGLCTTLQTSLDGSCKNFVNTNLLVANATPPTPNTGIA